MPVYGSNIYCMLDVVGTSNLPCSFDSSPNNVCGCFNLEGLRNEAMDSGAPPDITNTFGAGYIGTLVMMALYGITVLQTFMYFTRFPKDSYSLKLLVFTILVLDTLHIVLISQAMYHYLVSNFANSAALVKGTWTLYASVGVNVLISSLTQSYFAKRIHILNGRLSYTSVWRRWWLTSVITFLIFAHLCFGIETMIELFIIWDLTAISEITFKAVTPFAITALLSDIILAVALCYLLYNNRTGFKSTNKVVNYLIVYSINRTLLTVAVTIVEVITYLAAPNTLWFLAVDFTIGKLWANSFLATLNTRESLRGRGLWDDDDEFTEEREHAHSSSSLRIAPVTTSMFAQSQTGPSGTTTENIEVSMVLSGASQTHSSDIASSDIKAVSPRSKTSLAHRATAATGVDLEAL